VQVAANQAGAAKKPAAGAAKKPAAGAAKKPAAGAAKKPAGKREPAAKEAPAQGADPGITIDIPDVDADTPIGSLTVSQFVMLMRQIDSQLPKRAASPAEVEATVERIRAIMNGDDESSPDVREALRGAQNAILDNMPAMVRAARGRASIAAH
jgi:hypothetical protein